MANDFHSALIWHMERYETGATELSRATGVSRDAINKIIAREGSSTRVDRALAIAAFYGKTLEEFLRKGDSSAAALPGLIELLRPDEARLVEAQVRGILRARSPQSDD